MSTEPDITVGFNNGNTQDVDPVQAALADRNFNMVPILACEQNLKTYCDRLDIKGLQVARTEDVAVINGRASPYQVVRVTAPALDGSDAQQTKLLAVTPAGNKLRHEVRIYTDPDKLDTIDKFADPAMIFACHPHFSQDLTKPDKLVSLDCRLDRLGLSSEHAGLGPALKSSLNQALDVTVPDRNTGPVV